MILMSFFTGSRYLKCNFRRKNGNKFLVDRDRVNFTLSKCSFYTVIQGDTIDGISYKFYRNSRYWWCIMDANRQYESELDIKAGDIIAIPDEQEVLDAV